jgi:chromosome segregation ATPase
LADLTNCNQDFLVFSFELRCIHEDSQDKMSADEIYQSKYGQGRRLGDTEGQSSRIVELQADITKLKHSVAIAKRTLPSIEQAQGTIDSGLTQLNQDLIQANVALSEILNEPRAPDQIDVTRESLRQLVSHLKAANKLANDSIEESQRIRERTIEHMNHYLKPVNSTFKSINKNIKTEQGVLQANARRTKRQAEMSLVVSGDLQVDIQTKQTEISTQQTVLDEQREEVRILEARKKEAVRMMEEEEAEADRLQKVRLEIYSRLP